MNKGLYYTESIRGDESHTLLWLHGAGGEAAQWPYALRRLPGWRVWALDLPGHGRSSGKGLRSIEAYANEVLGWLDDKGAESVVLGGHSMGAAIALQIALMDGNRVRALVLLGAGGRMQVNPQMLQQLAIPQHVSGTISQIAQWSVMRGASPKLREKLAEQLETNREGVLYGDFLACSNFDLRAKLAHIKQPTLVLCGEEDRMMPAHEGQSLGEELVRGESTLVTGAGHMMMQERPQEVVALVEEFIAGLE